MLEKMLEIIFNRLARKQIWHSLLRKLTLYWGIKELAETIYGWTDKDTVLKTLLNISDYHFNKNKSNFLLVSKEWMINEKFEFYGKHDFCEAKKCPVLSKIKEDAHFKMDCNISCKFSAKQFHEWLKENGYMIIKLRIA